MRPTPMRVKSRLNLKQPESLVRHFSPRAFRSRSLIVTNEPKEARAHWFIGQHKSRISVHQGVAYRALIPVLATLMRYVPANYASARSSDEGPATVSAAE